MFTLDYVFIIKRFQSYILEESHVFMWGRAILDKNDGVGVFERLSTNYLFVDTS